MMKFDLEVDSIILSADMKSFLGRWISISSYVLCRWTKGIF